MKEPFLSHYRNSEFLQYIKDVLELMNRYDASVLGLTEQRDALVAIIVALDAAFQLDQRNEFTQVLLDLDTKRGNVYRGIKSILEGNTLHFSLTKQEAAKRLLFNLTSYGKDVIRMNYQAETAILDSMLADWNTDLTLQEAVVTLQLSEWVTELQRINIVFNERYLASVSETAANPTQSFSELRKDAIEVYRALIARIKAFMVLETNEAYKTLHSAIYVLAKDYNRVVKMRSSIAFKRNSDF